MAVPRKARRVAVLAVAFMGGLWVCDRWMMARTNADESAAAAPASQPAAVRPELSPEVKTLVDRLAASYAKLPVSVEAEMEGDFDVAGVVEKKKILLSGIASGPNVYRHEGKGQLIVASDGRTTHLFDVGRNQYASGAVDAAGDDMAATLAGATRQVLLQQNPALFIAVGNEAVEALAPEGQAVNMLPPQTEDGRTFDRLGSNHEGTASEVWIDREKGTIDRLTFDFTKALEEKGAANVKRATVVIRYLKTELAGAPPAADAFAFSPPSDATPLRLGGSGGLAAGEEPTMLEGKPAPSFELKDVEGKLVKSADMKGSVVVLDFWATWCPPCREGLPHLAAAAAKYGDRGVKVYAVNAQEDVATVKDFLAKEKLNLVALLDTDGAVNQKFGVSGIPQTVVIGADGVVRSVTVGFNPSDTTALDKAIEAALK